MYRPGNVDVSGIYEREISAPTPPPNVSTRHMTFVDMVEREVYTGASRNVGRNQKRESGRVQKSICPHFATTHRRVYTLITIYILCVNASSIHTLVFKP
jgi:hypothetical protein